MSKMIIKDPATSKAYERVIGQGCCTAADGTMCEVLAAPDPLGRCHGPDTFPDTFSSKCCANGKFYVFKEVKSSKVASKPVKKGVKSSKVANKPGTKTSDPFVLIPGRGDCL